jgi:cell division septation protein DedD
MPIRIIGLSMLLFGLLLGGCAEKQKEAEELEKEMMEQRAAADTAPETTGVDTAVPTDTAMPDARAVPAEEEAQTITQETPEGDFALQVAACENLGYARHLIDLYTERGYDPYLTTTVQDGQTFYRVRIGGFPTVAEATALQAEIRDKYSTKGWVDEIR